MIRGISLKYKQPIAYFFMSKGVVVNELKNILIEAAIHLKGIGLNPVAVICDQGPSNIGLLKQLNITPESPLFIVDNTEIYFFFDPPHLLKSTRNNLMKYIFKFNGKCAEWKHILRLYQYFEDKPYSPICKLTPIHLHPNNFEKMRVKYAAHIFSRAVSSSISMMIQKHQKH